MKRRIAAAVGTLLLFSWLALLGAYNAHQLFSRQAAFSWRLSVCAAALSLPAVRSWFLLLECCGILLISWMLFGREYIQYRSKTRRVCPNIETPEAYGQGQYGTARWMEPGEMDAAFTVVRMDLGAPRLRELAAHGRDDLGGAGV